MKYNSYIDNGQNKVSLLYACKVGSPSYMEEILFEQNGYVNKEEVMKKGAEWCAKNGYDRLRFVVTDLSTPPNFKQAINC